MRNTPLKNVIYFIIGTVINLALFSLSKYAGFPLWLDFTGSLYINSKCGLPFGIASVTVHTLFITILIDGPSALWLFLPYALACVALSFTAKDIASGKSYDPWKPSLLLILSVWVMHFLSVICAGTVGRYGIYSTAFNSLSALLGRFLGSLTLSGGIAVTECVPIIILLTVAFLLSPKNRDGLTFHK